MQMNEVLSKAHANRVAVGAFNILNYLTASAIVKQADARKDSVILQTSMSTVRAYGVKELGIMLHAIRKLSSYPVIIHLDHCRDVGIAKECIDGEWDSVMIDGSDLPFKENIAFTKKIVEYAHKAGKQVEGELGIIGGIEDEIKGGKGTEITFDDCITFIKETGIDLFAPAIGTAHGVYSNTPSLRTDLVAELSSRQEVPIVVHGGSGLSKEDFQKLILCGASKINISTAIKQGYLKAIRENDAGSDPLRLDKAVFNEVAIVAKNHMKIFAFDD